MTLDPGTTEATVAEPDAWQVKGKQLIRIAALTAEIAALANDADKDAEDPDTQRVNDRANKAMAEALAHLRSHPAAADAQRWIPVSERLPEIGTDCLVWHAGFNNIGPFAKIDRWDEQRECPVSFSTVTVPIGPGWDDSDFDDVLYWMLLPPPPAAMGAAPAQLAWTDNEGVHHSMSRESAAATLQQLFQEWPGGLEEIEASVTSWRNRAQESGWRHMAADYLAGLHAKQENSPTAHNYYACAARDLRESAAMGAAPSAEVEQPQQPETEAAKHYKQLISDYIDASQQPEKDHLATPCGQAAPEIGAVPVQSPAAGVLTLSPSELPPEKIAEYLQLCDEVDALGILGAGVADAAPMGQAAPERGAEREPMTHTLKIDPIPFQAVKARIKKHELRKADRDFRVGDTLHLLETVSTGAEMAAGAPLEYTGGEDIVRVTHILRGPIYGLAEGWCVMSIEDAAPASVGQEPEPYRVGNIYRTQGGELVKFVGASNVGTSYETMFDEDGVHRYTRRDFGRVTGSPHDYSDPRNTPPLYTHPAPSTDALREPRNGEDGYVCPTGKAQALAREDALRQSHRELMAALKGVVTWLDGWAEVGSAQVPYDKAVAALTRGKKIDHA
jgi:Domain of unknown function (DUF3850)